MKLTRNTLISLGFVVAAFAIAAALYSRLPELVPTHWNARGEADGFTPKPWGPFLLPLSMAGTYIFLMLIPQISPRGYGTERFQSVFEIIQASLLAMLLAVTAVTLFAGIGVPMPIERITHIATGLLFIVIGNFLGKVTKNFFVGIRTPWTLASDEVWLRTHRLAGKLFVIAGIGLVASSFAGGGTVALLVAVGLAAAIPAVYSYILYRRLEANRSETSAASPNS